MLLYASCVQEGVLHPYYFTVSTWNACRANVNNLGKCRGTFQVMRYSCTAILQGQNAISNHKIVYDCSRSNEVSK